MKSSKRPSLLFWFSLGVLGFSIYYLVRLALSFVQLNLPLSVPVWYLPLTGAIWGAAGAVAAYGLLRGQAWALRLMRGGTVAFVLWYWLDRIFLACSDYLRLTWPLALIITLLAVLSIFWILSRPVIQEYFGERRL
ncbi:MAG: hypothetical protein PVI78_09485 [Anaerolineales bacterium]